MRLLVAGCRRVCAVAVCEHQLVLAVGVLVEIVDALVLEQAVDEGEVGLAVLDAVGPLPIGAGESLLEVGESMVAEDRRDDVRDRLVLKDPAVGGARQKPEPGHQGGAIQCQAPLEADMREAIDVAVEKAPLPGRQQQRHRGRGAQQVVCGDIDLLAEQRELVLEWRAQALRAGHAGKEQLVRAERGVDRDCPSGLTGGHNVALIATGVV